MSTSRTHLVRIVGQEVNNSSLLLVSSRAGQSNSGETSCSTYHSSGFCVVLFVVCAGVCTVLGVFVFENRAKCVRFIARIQRASLCVSMFYSILRLTY